MFWDAAKGAFRGMGALKTQRLSKLNDLGYVSVVNNKSSITKRTYTWIYEFLRPPCSYQEQGGP